MSSSTGLKVYPSALAPMSFGLLAESFAQNHGRWLKLHLILFGSDRWVREG